MNQIVTPKNYEVQRDAMYQKKIEECKSKLDAFLKKENMFIGAYLNYGQTGMTPEVMVLPREFIKEGKLPTEQTLDDKK
ncbi:MAG: hypothetical protein WD512_03965 [Candidatus Paceibacterota bacterium]